MRPFLLLAVLFLVRSVSAQCPFAVTLNSSGNCLGATLNVSTSSTLTKIEWYKGSSIVKTVTDPGVITVAGGNGTGSADNQIVSPEGLYVDAAGDVYVSDPYNNRVQKWAPGATSGITVVGGNGAGSAANQLNQPWGVWLDGAGNLYVAEGLNDRVTKWAPGATVGVTVAGGNGTGWGANQFWGAGSAIIDGAGNIYVLDFNNQRVQKWAPGATTGVTVAGGNGPGPAANQLWWPYAIFVDAAGNVYVADGSNQRIQKWAPGATTGVTVAGGNGFGSAANQLGNPDGVWVDAAGNIYIADEDNNRIQKWAPGATSGVTVAGGNGQGSAANQLSGPTAIVVDAAGNIYVADAGNARVQKFYSFTLPTSYKPVDAGVYTAVVTDNAGCQVTTNAITIDPAVTPAITISQTAATLCSNTPVFTAAPVNGGSAPVYQWLLNGANVGTNSPTYANNGLQHRDQVSCILTSNAQCATTPTAVSNALVVSLPAVITLSNKGSNCAGTDTLLVASPDPLAQIVWQNDGGTLGTVSATVAPAVGITVAGGNGVGYAANQLNFPLGTYVDAAGNVYVADNTNNRIQKWAPGATSGITVAGSSSTLWQPEGVFVDAAGYIYVADAGNNRVQRFPPGSTALTAGVTVAGGNGNGFAANQLNLPRMVFVDGSGNLYVVDQYNERVQKFPPGSTSATPGVTVAGNLGNPLAVYVDAAGNMYIAESGYDQVTKWAPGATTGVVVAGGNGRGAAANQLDGPDGVYVDAGGNIYVSDELNNRVQKWAPGAVTGITVAGGNGAGTAPNQMSYPGGMSLDSYGNIYVNDVTTNSVRKWIQQPVIDTTYKAITPGTYTAVVNTGTGCAATSNSIVVKPVVNTSVSISTPATAVCGGTNITFTATPGNGGASPDYQWKLNGANIGANAPTYASSQLADGNVISCVMTSKVDCPLPATPVSNDIPLTITPLTKPTLSISSSATTICSGQPVSFSAAPLNGGAAPIYQWQANGMNVGTNSPTYASSSLADRDVITCGMISDAACLVSADAGSNSISVTVHPTITPVVNITASSPVICAGDQVSFTAVVTDGGTEPAYQWQVNGLNAGNGSSIFKSKGFSNDDEVVCSYTSNSGCGDALSNDIRLVVNPLPEVAGGQTTIQAGETIPLHLQATGDITSYSWSPDYALSDSAIPNPLATPAKTTTYTLLVTTAEGCKASAPLIVNVIRDLKIPSAFTPNGDGKNDIFYVLGGPAGSEVKDLSVYNRWGQRVFQVHDVPPGDPAFGWNGAGATGGTYVYTITMKFKDGSQQVLQGTILLVR